MANDFNMMPWLDWHIPTVPYQVDDTDKELTMWTARVRTYFPDLYKKAVEFRFRQSVIDPKHCPRSILVLEDNGSIFEISVNSGTGSASARLISSSNEQQTN